MRRLAVILILLSGCFPLTGCADDPDTAVVVRIRFGVELSPLDQFQLVGGPVDPPLDNRIQSIPDEPGGDITESPALAVVLVPDSWAGRSVELTVLGLRDGVVVGFVDVSVTPARGKTTELEAFLQQGTPSCGNGIIEPGERCDATDFAGQSCVTAAGLTEGALACTGDTCQVDVSGCFECGNGAIEGPEACDGVEFGARTCQTEGFQGGTLTCRTDCTLETVSCEVGCGNGVRDPGEECDGADFDGLSCFERTGLTEGALACDASCRVDVSGCFECGNGRIEPAEECDGLSLGFEDCVDRGFTGGSLACGVTCQFDDSGCFLCGDGVCETMNGEDGLTCPADCP